MKDLVCVDSNIFIWGIKGYASPTQQDMIPYAQRFIYSLSSKKLLLPAPMLAELLSPVPPSEHQTILSLLDSRFIIAPFDAPAAAICGELINHSIKDPELSLYRTNHAVPKQKMKYDCMITAICIVREVECLYSNDGDVAKFANGRVLVKTMPMIPPPVTQKNLFDAP